MFSKLFKKKNDIVIYSPIKGKIVDISEVPDPVFSDKIMGEGIAVIPEDNIICSPVNGYVAQIFKTKHAILLKSSDDLEIIIHIGLETVNLNGEGFEVLINEGDEVTTGKKLIKVDFEFMKNKGINTIIPVVIINHADRNIIKYFGDKQTGAEIMKISQ
ncbi:PTS sugar transporter subunit IIA [Clostridium beijerinckii]|jgi:PTS system IIA component, Glc family (TC 4.A.1)|uniref:PTS glucose transporter subunit IIA n=3 Tax=Clostridium beijerinckii TaxID=1520 RepID=A0AAE2RMS9_CLOBE|nr:PTS glucose transporter subunit IIA [Clostridium beijerinckii]ABR37088.1 PTS system, glucose subfamily, IIA subunit [Clostridium beijerinckii NCIMB 8052]AIU04545.1 PTS system, glucose subfamily, IIA subunit [Clostridium beijerinckii ATCC 35702]MBF7808262.1 PTS glucose transporter subunit IIA [Clostridium beijerinckii]NRT21830.1 glucose-specific phosphotransferase system IIA component [Clostridium beijerinckii]NRT65664.1 glucose-specific phosphotransferase system IIA component [Clostridium b